MCIFVLFVCSFINYACPNFRTTYAMALMFTLQHELEPLTLPSIPPNGHVGGRCQFCFIIICQNFFPVLFSSNLYQFKLLYYREQVFHRQPFFRTEDFALLVKNFWTKKISFYTKISKNADFGVKTNI